VLTRILGGRIYFVVERITISGYQKFSLVKCEDFQWARPWLLSGVEMQVKLRLKGREVTTHIVFAAFYYFHTSTCHNST